MKSLEQVLSEKRNESNADRAKLEQRRAEWLTRINGLYQGIELWLGPLQLRGDLTVERQRHEVTEEILGSYVTDLLRIRFYNGRFVELRPVGLHVAGANGRIDMDLHGKLVMILGRQDGSSWEFVESFGTVGGSRRTSEMLPFNEENFESLLADFVAGF